MVKCPLCQNPVEAYFSRNVAKRNKVEKWFRAVHSLHPYDCPLRFEDLGEGPSEKEALQNAQDFFNSITAK